MSEVGIWSLDKYKLLGDYINTYPKIVGKGKFENITYIDGFAGDGYHTIRGIDKTIDGSPIIAWKSFFNEYHFIDLNSNKLEMLKKCFSEIGLFGKKASFHNMDSNLILPMIFNSLKYNHKSWRALCLLDPYGANIKWSTIQQASEITIKKRDNSIIRPIELIIHFSLMSLQMNAMLKDKKKLDKEKIKYYNDFFGNENWQSEIYEKQQTLFSDIEMHEKRFDSEKRILMHYKKRLEQVGYTYVNLSHPLKNSTNATLYYLIFASSHPAGNRLASSIISSLEKQNG